GRAPARLRPLSVRPQLLALEDRVLPGEAVLGLLTMSLWAGALAPAVIGPEATEGARARTSGDDHATLPAVDRPAQATPDRPVWGAALSAADLHSVGQSASSPSPPSLGDSGYRPAREGQDGLFALLPFLGLAANARPSPGSVPSP